jgi:ATP-dependent DNA helicase RecG
MIFGQESETLEFKKTTAETKEAVNDVAAILNKHGRGELYFGIRNDGIVSGQTVSDSTLRDVSRAITDNLRPQIYPVVENVSINNKHCIRVQFEGNDPPYFAYGRAYIRVADENKQLSPEELEKFFKKKQEQLTTWDSEASGKMVDDVNTNTLRSYMKKANECGRLPYRFTDRKDILNRLQLLNNSEPNNTAIAMFGKNAFAEIQMAIFATDVKHTFIDIDRKKGTISDMVDAGELYVRSHIRWRVVRDGSVSRMEIPEIPIEAVREALLNSYAHRDWRIPQTNEIAIYSNRIEIYNPGTFPDGLTPQDFIDGKGKSFRRNPLLAQIMYYSKDIESFGTGLRKIVLECEGANVRYDFDLGKLGFSVIFYRTDVHGENITDTLSTDYRKSSGSQTEVKRKSSGSQAEVKRESSGNQTVPITDSKGFIASYLDVNQKVTASEIAQCIGVSNRWARSLLHQMAEEGVLLKIGDNRFAYYVLNRQK